MGFGYFKDQINSLVEDLVTEAKNWDMSKLGPLKNDPQMCNSKIRGGPCWLVYNAGL